MTHPEIKEVVTQEYAKRYPNWTDFHVTEIVVDTFGGHVAAVRAKDENKQDNEELCFVYPEGTVRIFYTTEELAKFLEQKAKTPTIERLFTRPVLTGIVFAFLLVAVFVIGFQTTFRPEALSILGSVVGVAAGFFFGSSRTTT
jgi:hypothetical protein